MSQPTHRSSACPRAELETVTNWPLILGALVVVVLPVLLVSGLALVSYLSTPAPADTAVRVREEPPAPDAGRATGSVVRSAPVAVPAEGRVSAVKVIETPSAGRPESPARR